MFLKLLISFFSLLILSKNTSYAIYEFNTNKNIFGAISIFLFSIISVSILNTVLFFINY